jgi:hypoxanthine phosphoribosyltransferase
MAKPTTLTMDRTDLRHACATLATHLDGFAPDAMVGIATGGSHVAHELVDHLSARPTLTHVRLSRPGTELKKRLSAGQLLRRLPTFITDHLRWLEVASREQFVRVRRRHHAELPASLNDHPDLPAALAGATRVLIVDDTVDSGNTLKLAEALVAAAAPGAEIRTAVLTSTWKRPPVKPHYCLYHRTLVRFFWSFDADASETPAGVS